MPTMPSQIGVTIQHITPCMNLMEPLENYMSPSQMGEGAWRDFRPNPISLKVAMASAEIKIELVYPLITPSFPPGTHNYDPNVQPHWRSEQMYDHQTRSPG